ncbi:HIRAN domain-containing protein [Sphingomonas gellani]|uniref:HIRAN domain-containing protein n=1 Tax=Sphingomonas gellani TaxID=1166340 RepID=A0A1H8DLS2_9SPHN|nr:HIRAN domain-containing protein [Sphingomonas gellani]SEN08219.1 HIRAN domain-containing protein [Sphingomonas gellani]
MDEMTLAVVGLDHPNSDKARSNRRYDALLCVPGEPVELRPEPDNPHDPHAVAVFGARGVQIGYLTAERAPWIGARIRAGEAAVALFQGMGGNAAFVRIRFGGDAPTLPPAAPRSQIAVAEYADPDGPEWGA